MIVDAARGFRLANVRPANSGIQLKPGDMLGVRSSNANDLAFQVYGMTGNVAG